MKTAFTNSINKIDFIGDIHGHADELEALLIKLGYEKSDGVYAHPERKVLFVGDYIDRGPKIKETLAIVKAMVESDNAIALMGNHEYNALCFHYEDTKGGHLRKHSIKNVIQHYDTLKQFQNKQEDYEAYLEWFKTLPLYFETDTFKAVHACWDNTTIAYLKKTLVNDRLTDALISQSVKKGKLHDAIEQTLKGKEIKLPKKLRFYDEDGAPRTEMRIKWWEDPSKMTYKSISVLPIEALPEQQIELSELKSPDFYRSDDKHVFFGHYWLKGEPSLYKDNVCCLDYSVAKEGKLVAYRLHGETILDDRHLVYVKNHHMTQEVYQEALKFAGEKHSEQKVPGTTANYLLHISNVAMEVMMAHSIAKDFDIDFAIQIAILHDTIEDTDADFEEIKHTFGDAIAKAVQALTKDDNLPSKQEQMTDSLQRINGLQKEVGLVKIADRITNLQRPPSHWGSGKIANYCEEAKLISRTLSNKNAYLNKRLESKIVDYEQNIKNVV